MLFALSRDQREQAISSERLLELADGPAVLLIYLSYGLSTASRDQREQAISTER